MHFSTSEALDLASFKEMDALAVREYELPIALMMESAGLALARLIAHNAGKEAIIIIGIGNGNNGGGGLVASRRLCGWGYKVSLDIPVPITNELPKLQLKRALLFGAIAGQHSNATVWVDAYLGFSQRLPLSEEFTAAVNMANASGGLKISLDLPTGISADNGQPMFRADKVLTLAAPKLILNSLPASTEVLVADIGIPEALYKKFHIEMPDFIDLDPVK